MNVLIIEDELLAQFELKRLLAECGVEIEILGVLDSIKESVAWLRTHELPDLLFLDIQLADGLSFEIFKQVEITTPVIFTTAYDEYAIQAFQVNSLDYLLKPIELDDLRSSLQKYAAVKAHYGAHPQPALTPTQIDQLLNFRQPTYKARFVSKLGDHLRHIPVEDIAYFYANDKLVFLVTKDNKEFPLEYTLNELTTMLDPKQFYRVNRTYCMHITALTQVVKQFDGRLKVSCTPPAKEPIWISRQKAAEFKQWLDS
jgi:DNA-binding LytR/AlgR family response regulator